MSKTIVLKPRLSEKTYAISETQNSYVFEVPEGVNNHMVAKAVVAQYSVGVKSVRLANIPGKTKRSLRKGARAYQSGKRNRVRKAIVTLKEGDKLPIFAAVEAEKKAEQEAEEKAQKKADKEKK